MLNSIARGVVQVVKDSGGMQELQLGVLEGEDIDDAERFQPYGFSSVPLEGAEAVVLFPGGDRAHPLVVAVEDRRHRPTGKDPGEVCLYSNAGQLVILKADGSVEVSCAPGGTVTINDGSGGAALATKADIDLLTGAFNTLVTAYGTHIHGGVTPGAPGDTSGPPTVAGTPATPAVGTLVTLAK